MEATINFSRSFNTVDGASPSSNIMGEYANRTTETSSFYPRMTATEYIQASSPGPVLQQLQGQSVQIHNQFAYLTEYLYSELKQLLPNLGGLDRQQLESQFRLDIGHLIAFLRSNWNPEPSAVQHREINAILGVLQGLEYYRNEESASHKGQDVRMFRQHRPESSRRFNFEERIKNVQGARMIESISLDSGQEGALLNYLNNANNPFECRQVQSVMKLSNGLVDWNDIKLSYIQVQSPKVESKSMKKSKYVEEEIEAIREENKRLKDMLENSASTSNQRKRYLEEVVVIMKESQSQLPTDGNEQRQQKSDGHSSQDTAKAGQMEKSYRLAELGKGISIKRATSMESEPNDMLASVQDSQAQEKVVSSLMKKPSELEILRVQNTIYEERVIDLQEENAQLRKILYQVDQKEAEIIAQAESNKRAYEESLNKSKQQIDELKKYIVSVQAKNTPAEPKEQGKPTGNIVIPQLLMGANLTVSRSESLPSVGIKSPKTVNSAAANQSNVDQSNKMVRELLQKIKQNPEAFVSQSTVVQLTNLVDDYEADLVIMEEQNQRLKEMVISYGKLIEEQQMKIDTNRAMTQKDEEMLEKIIEELQIERRNNTLLRQELEGYQLRFKESGGEQHLSQSGRQAPQYQDRGDEHTGRSRYENHHYEDNGEIDTLRLHIKKLRQEDMRRRIGTDVQSKSKGVLFQHSEESENLVFDNQRDQYNILLQELERKLVTLSSLVIPDLEAELLKYQRLCEQCFLKLEDRELVIKELKADLLILRCQTNNTHSRFQKMPSGANKSTSYIYSRDPFSPANRNRMNKKNLYINTHQQDCISPEEEYKCIPARKDSFGAYTNSMKNLQPVSSKARLQLLDPAIANGLSKPSKQPRHIRLDQLSRSVQPVRLITIMHIMHRLYDIFAKMAKDPQRSTVLTLENLYLIQEKDKNVQIRSPDSILSRILDEEPNQIRLKLVELPKAQRTNFSMKYLAPELIRAGQQPSEKTLAWNLGVILEDLLYVNRSRAEKKIIQALRGEQENYDLEPLHNLVRDLTLRDPSARMSLGEYKSIVDNEIYKLSKSQRKNKNNSNNKS